jgi:hypothetical protein
VRSSVVVSAQRLDGGPTDPAQYLSVERLFGVIDEAIREDAARIRVVYDARLGFPADVYIDWDERLADEEFGYEVRDLTAN